MFEKLSPVSLKILLLSSKNHRSDIFFKLNFWSHFCRHFDALTVLLFFVWLPWHVNRYEASDFTNLLFLCCFVLLFISAVLFISAKKGQKLCYPFVFIWVNGANWDVPNLPTSAWSVSNRFILYHKTFQCNILGRLLIRLAENRREEKIYRKLLKIARI